MLPAGVPQRSAYEDRVQVTTRYHCREVHWYRDPGCRLAPSWQALGRTRREDLDGSHHPITAITQTQLETGSPIVAFAPARFVVAPAELAFGCRSGRAQPPSSGAAPAGKAAPADAVGPDVRSRAHHAHSDAPA